MKSFTAPIAAGAFMLSMASIAMGQSMCAVQCFQSVVTEHPPTTCTEDNMYLCFCKSQSLQNYFIDCAYTDCADQAEAAIGFGVTICAEYGAPITIPPRVTDTPTSEAPTEPATEEPASTTEPAVTEAATTSVAAVETSAASTLIVIAQTSTASSVIAKPTAAGNATTPASPPVVEVNLGATNAVSGMAVLAGVAMVAML